MKKKNEMPEKFNSVEYFRKVKEKIARETKNMGFNEYKEYIHKKLSSKKGNAAFIKSSQKKKAA